MRSKSTCPALLPNMLIAPLVPAGTIAMFEVTNPSTAFNVDTVGWAGADGPEHIRRCFWRNTAGGLEHWQNPGYPSHQ